MSVHGTAAIPVVAVLAAVALTALRSAFVTVEDGEWQGLTVWGSKRGVLGPGRHRVPPLVADTTVIPRETHEIPVPNVAVHTDDGDMAVELSVAVTVTDPETAFAADYAADLAGIARRNAAAAMRDVLADGDEDVDRVAEFVARKLESRAPEVGVEIATVGVERVSVEEAAEAPRAAAR